MRDPVKSLACQLIGFDFLLENKACDRCIWPKYDWLIIVIYVPWKERR